MERSGHLSLIAFSGTLDRLYPVAILASAGVAMGMRVDVFLTFWGLLAARREPGDVAGRISQDYGPQAADAFLRLAREKNLPSWKDMLAQAKELGEVHVKACGMTMDLFGLQLADLDPLVEEVVGAGEFLDGAQTNGAMVLVF